MADLTADILVDGQLSAEHEALIRQTLAEFGTDGRIRVLPLRRGTAELQWLILVTLPLQAFLGSVGSKFGEDAYKGLQNAIRKLLRIERQASEPTRPIVLKDDATGLQIVLDPDLPSAGYQQLLTLNLPKFRFGPLRYDRAKGRWRSEIDEAEAAST